jgi:hypothetical protein
VRAKRASGAEIDAEFLVVESLYPGAGFDIVLKARSGGANPLNPDYFEVLELILGWLASAGAKILNIEVDSNVTRKLAPDERRLALKFPLHLDSVTDLVQLRKGITSAQTTVGRRPDAKASGGNSHKRIRMAIDAGATLSNVEAAQEWFQAHSSQRTNKAPQTFPPESSRSPEHFVYPISDTSKYAIAGDEEIDARTFFASTERGEKATWRLATNYRKIQEWDYIWAYFTMPHGEIKSVGRVTGGPFPHDSWDEWAIEITWAPALSAELLQSPIPYSAFEQRIWGAAEKANKKTTAVLDGWLRGRSPSIRKAMDRDVKMALQLVSRRQGQSAFRQELLVAQESRCAVTGCRERDVLQAAHIKGVSDEGRHSVRNGLLLRADIHTLFDKGLLIIDHQFTVRVDKRVLDSEYRALDGRHLKMLEKLSLEPHGPDCEALRWHRQSHNWD